MSFLVYGSMPIPLFETLASFGKAGATLVRGKKLKTKLRGVVGLATAFGRFYGIPGAEEFESWSAAFFREPYDFRKEVRSLRRRYRKEIKEGKEKQAERTYDELSDLFAREKSAKLDEVLK
jgi:hypothetical protein